ncbi:TIGR02677 family protein [Nonomuraea sp. NPDC004580]|uniref:TIGR02677 family protein n=1 Tax=Nonomuraea sp. NPDC004580 TaxID=3154552 RepID=UPI0033A97CB1
MAGAPQVPPELFRFTTTERADLHTAVLFAFGEADERLETALTADEVRERLRATGCYAPVGEQDLAGTLKQLAGWGLLDVVFDHAGGFATAEEYERRNLQYSLTGRGAAALAGIRHAMAALDSAGALQTAVLDAIAARLAELNELLHDPDPGRNRRIFACLMELEAHLDALRTDTRRFNADLQRLLRAEGTDLATFHEVKTATVAYLQQFVTDLEHRTDTITTLLHPLIGGAAHPDQGGRPGEGSPAADGGRGDPAAYGGQGGRGGLVRHSGRSVAVLHARALDGADLPRMPGADHATPWLAARVAQWEGLLAWFAPEDGSVPRVRRLHDVARRAIVVLLQVLDRITDARRRSSSAAADFRTLARWFATAPGEDDAHRLWDAAFGLGSARHAHLGHADAELIPAGVPWAEAEPVEVSALLRSRGRTERMGRTGRVRDVAELRAQRRAMAERERAELEAAWAALATTGPIRLSQLGELDHDTFGRLLDLVGRALAERPDPTGFRRAVTSDGRVEIVLRAPDDAPTEREVAVLRTSEGWFRSPDYLIDVRAPGTLRERVVGA